MEIKKKTFLKYCKNEFLRDINKSSKVFYLNLVILEYGNDRWLFKKIRFLGKISILIIT